VKQPVGVYRQYFGRPAAGAHLAELPAERAQLPPTPSTVSVGSLLGAEFVAATGGDMTWFATAGRLAAFARVAPAPRDSGRQPATPAPLPPAVSTGLSLAA
jgi:hypothetical protein